MYSNFENLMVASLKEAKITSELKEVGGYFVDDKSILNKLYKNLYLNSYKFVKDLKSLGEGLLDKAIESKEKDISLFFNNKSGIICKVGYSETLIGITYSDLDLLGCVNVDFLKENGFILNGKYIDSSNRLNYRFTNYDNFGLQFVVNFDRNAVTIYSFKLEENDDNDDRLVIKTLPSNVSEIADITVDQILKDDLKSIIELSINNFKIFDSSYKNIIEGSKFESKLMTVDELIQTLKKFFNIKIKADEKPDLAKIVESHNLNSFQFNELQCIVDNLYMNYEKYISSRRLRKQVKCLNTKFVDIAELIAISVYKYQVSFTEYFDWLLRVMKRNTNLDDLRS
jgi:hypothetical protein